MYVDAAYCYKRSSVVCLSVSLSVTIAMSAKTAEPIEIKLGMLSGVGPGNHACSRKPCIRWGEPSRAEAMRPYVKLLWPLAIVTFILIFVTTTITTKRAKLKTVLNYRWVGISFARCLFYFFYRCFRVCRLREMPAVARACSIYHHRDDLPGAAACLRTDVRPNSPERWTNQQNAEIPCALLRSTEPTRVNMLSAAAAATY